MLLYSDQKIALGVFEAFKFTSISLPQLTTDCSLFTRAAVSFTLSDLSDFLLIGVNSYVLNINTLLAIYAIETVVDEDTKQRKRKTRAVSVIRINVK